MEKSYSGKLAIGASCEKQVEDLVCRKQRAPQGESEEEKVGKKSGAVGRFFITPHAVARYRERVHRGISYERALCEIIEQSNLAHYVKNYNTGQYWRGPKPMRIRLIVAPAKDNDLPHVVTILPAADNMVQR